MKAQFVGERVSVAPPKPGRRSDGVRTLEALQERCRQNEETGCLEWAGAVLKGSGMVWLPGLGAYSVGGALSLLIDGERPSTASMWVPRCGNVLCCTIGPQHRVRGTRSDMMTILRPTLSVTHRMRIAATKRKAGLYTPELRAQILASDELATTLGPKLGLDHTTVSRIRRGEMWADLHTLAGLGVRA